MQKYRSGEWMFLNCNSPADLTAEYEDTDGVRLFEYDRCRNGHMLVSKFFADSTQMEFSTVISEMEDAAGVGIYCGKGSYTDYILAVVQKDRVSLRIPNGVPLGDTFRYEGAKRYYEIAEAKVRAALPLRLRFRKKKEQVEVWYEEERVLRGHLPAQMEERHARIMLQAVNMDSAAKVSAVFREWQLCGRSQESCCIGTCIWQEDGSRAAGVSLHLTGFRDMWTETDEKGHFLFHKLPYGSYICVAGKEETGFQSFRLIHDKIDRQYEISAKPAVRREGGAQRALETDAETADLNGIWRFDWDKERKGEMQGWFSPGVHKWSRRIEVPFSWQSLAAFGEGFLADAYSLSQNCAWVTNPEEMGNTAWYQKDICLTEEKNMDIVLGAVTGFGKVWLDDKLLGCTVDSYNETRFSLGTLQKDRTYLLTVQVVYDFSSRSYCSGKQGFWFTDAPGIWQNVWLEETKPARVEDILIEYKLDTDEWTAEIHARAVLEVNGTEQDCAAGEESLYKIELGYRSAGLKRLELHTKNGCKCVFQAEATGKGGYYDRKSVYALLKKDEKDVWITEENGEVFRTEYLSVKEVSRPEYAEIQLGEERRQTKVEVREDGSLEAEFTFHMDKAEPWEPDNPFMYRTEVTVWKGAKMMGKGERKLGLRRIETAGRQILLNGKPLFLRGVLDQGYNPWGIYTYPFFRGMRRGAMEFDIRKAKEYGYNLIRMHIKDNEPLWYGLCDEAGMLVWDEHPSNFYATWDDPLWRNMYGRQLRAMAKKQNYHPGIILYSVFNESWGITGGHEMSPWEEPQAQEWQKEMTCLYKGLNKDVLVIDNSGYAKTRETQVLDYHMYPDSYSAAENFFGRLTKVNYRGSTFNCYNEGNKELMKDPDVRELLQNNCSMDLKELNYKGKEMQEEQPVVISEFVHTNQIEQLLRTLSGVAGYTRMNLSSQENEDTSPLTNIRTERDFGFVHEDFSAAGYSVINSKNLITAVFPPLTKQEAGTNVEIPVFLSLWEAELEGKELRLEITVKGTDMAGTEGIFVEKRETDVAGRCYEPYLGEKLRFGIPEGMKALHIFFSLYEQGTYEKGRLLCENSLQMEIMPGPDAKESVSRRILSKCGAAKPYAWRTEALHGIYESENRQLLWMKGKGVLIYRLPVEGYRKEKTIFRIELSACECMEGTRLTDETLYPGEVKLRIGECESAIFLPDAPCDRKGIFSNSASAREKEFCYKYSGRWGYGYQTEIPVPERELTAALEKGYMDIRIESGEAGIVVYGSRMGRYGCDPVLIKDAPKD